jgi:hypothetical protein
MHNQDKNTVGPQVRQQTEAFLVKGAEVYNRREATAFAARSMKMSLTPIYSIFRC